MTLNHSKTIETFIPIVHLPFGMVAMHSVDVKL